MRREKVSTQARRPCHEMIAAGYVVSGIIAAKLRPTISHELRIQVLFGIENEAKKVQFSRVYL